MAFWGVEVKSGKPISHPSNIGRGRLHISQATLGIGTSMKNSVVQCNVGNSSPVFLCSLFPEKSESCQLHLEFDEVDEVIFSVIGPRSVHLTGYYLPSGQRRVMDDESESYGEDIRDTETERSDDDDQYEDSFIDDGDEQINPSSPVSSDGVEETSDKRMPKSERSNRRHLRKKYQHIESDDDSVSLKQQTSTDGSSGGNGMDTDAEDACPISSLVKPKPSAKRRSHAQQKAQKEIFKASKDAKDELNSFPLSERKSHAAIDSEPKSQKEKINPQIDAKLKKSKTQSKETKRDSECVDDFFFGNALKWDKTKKNETELEPFGQSFPNVSAVIEKNADIEKADSKQNSKPKKKRKQRTEEKVTEVDKDNHDNDVIKEDESRQDDTNTEKLDNDPAMTNLRHQEKGSNGNFDSNVNQSCDENLSKKKKKRKKTDRMQENGMVSNVVPVIELHMEKSSADIKNSNVNEASRQLKILSNKLVIEELEPGKPDGKIASTGKKISIYYSGKVKDSGEVFDSNVNGSPVKFRLGGENVLGDWTVGLDGMRVGEKRKIFVPPSLSFENEGDHSNVPPNSWLEYHVELLKVR